MYGIIYLVLDFDNNACISVATYADMDVRNWIVHPTNLETCISPNVFDGKIACLIFDVFNSKFEWLICIVK